MAYSLLLDPIYSLHGVSVNLTLAGGRILSPLAIDKTAGIDTGDNVEVPTIRPGATIRVAELASFNLKPRLLPGATLEINGNVWKVASYRLRPSPLGENEGEVLLVLSNKTATGTLPVVGTFDYAAILYDPIYLIHGVPLALTPALAIEPVTFTGLDKTSGVNVGDNVAVPTIKPAACLRMSDLTAAGLTLADLPKASVELNGFTWNVLNYRLRPSPDGEAEGEVLLVLNGQAVAVPRHAIAAGFTDDAGALFRLTMEARLVAHFADEGGMLARIRKTPKLRADFADDEGFTARIRKERHIAAAFADDLGAEIALRHPIRLRAAFLDESSFLALLTVQANIAADFADDAGFAVTITKNPFHRLLADFLDDAGFDATIRKYRNIAASFADDDGFSATLSFTNNLVANEFAGASPFIGSPSLAQFHALTANAFAGASPSIGSPTIGQKHALTGTAFAGAAASIGSPTIHQKHALTATAFAGAAASIGSPSITTGGSLSALTNRGDTQINNQASGTFSFNSAAIGTAAADRWVFGIFFAKNATNRNLLTVTIGGLTASVEIPVGTLNQQEGMVGICFANVPTGTTANFVFTFDGGFTANTSNGMGLTWYTVNGPVNPTATDTYSQNANSNPSKTFTVQGSGGFALVGGVPNNVNRAVSGDFTADRAFVQYVGALSAWAGHANNATAGPVSKQFTATSWTSGVNIPAIGRAYAPF